MSFYIVDGVKLNSTYIPYRKADLSPELEKELLNSGARVAQSYRGTRAAKPMVSITTEAIASVLGITGLYGAVLTACEIYLVKHDAAAVTSGSAHRKIAMTKALASVRSIDTGDGIATLTIEVHGVYDGTNDVYTITDGVSLPTQPRVTDVWYQGPIYIGSTEYLVESSTFNPGTEVFKRISNGEVGPRFVGQLPAKPTISVQAADGVLHGLADAFGDNVSTVVMFYRKGATGSSLRVADATETHISLTIPEALLTPDAISGTPGQAVAFGVMFDVGDDGTNAAVTLDTTAAIAAPE